MVEIARHKLTADEMESGRRKRHELQRKEWLERIESIKKRLAAGMTQAEIAREDGVTPQAINKALKRINPVHTPA